MTTHLLPVYDPYPITIDSGCGCYVTDTQGQRYLDAMTGIGVNALGYAHPRITAAIVCQAQRLIHTSNAVEHPYQAELARRLCEMSAMDRVFFSSTGTEAVEAALKAARARGSVIHPAKTRLVALNDSFHGRTFGSLAITGRPGYRKPFEPLTPEVTFVDANDRPGLEQAVSSDTAAIVVEPVLGEGGIVPLTDEFLRLARALASRSGALLIADEVQCGLGRTGRHFAYQWSGIQPDIVTLAKPLAAGLPLGVTLFTESAAGALPKGTHGTTFGGGPLACRVALEFLAMLDGLLPNVTSRGRQIMDGLERLRAKHRVITEIRGRGLMIGIQLACAARPLALRALQHGLLINATNETVLRLLPPYILTAEEAGEIVGILDCVLEQSFPL